MIFGTKNKRRSKWFYYFAHSIPNPQIPISLHSQISLLWMEVFELGDCHKLCFLNSSEGLRFHIGTSL